VAVTVALPVADPVQPTLLCDIIDDDEIEFTVTGFANVTLPQALVAVTV